MTVELVLFIAILGLMFSLVPLWGLFVLRAHQEKVNFRVWKRLNYLEVGMSHHGLIPMPWEVEDMENLVDEIKSFKREENVVYLVKKD